MTLTGLAADAPSRVGAPTITRRILSVTAMLVGAIVGAILARDHGARGGLVLAVAILVAVTISAMLLGRRLTAID
jgi:uncharacterized membrane protein YoaK (UPF0700 family)